VLPAGPTIPPQYRGAAYQFEVSTTKKTVKVIPPTSGTINGPSGSVNLDVKPSGVGGVRQSLLGPEVIDIRVVPGSFVAGPLNNPTAGKRLISFDVIIDNKLNSVNLIKPTFPTPPAGAAGPLLFPFEITVPTTSGGATGGPGSIVVVPPRGGSVTVNTEWDGSPFNFFNDAGCGATANDCFRYEEFSVIQAAQSSNARKIGFEIDASVGDFTVKVIAAADLQNSTGGVGVGTISGVVSSPQLGNLGNVNVGVSGGFSGTTAAGTGAYSIANVTSGSRTVSVTGGLPAGCAQPADQTVTLAAAGTQTVNFSVTCNVPTGTVGGVITSSLGGGIQGVTVTLTPNGGSALPAFTTGASGGYTFGSVPVADGTGSITLGNLPAGCTNASPYSYTGLTNGGSVTRDIVVTCAAAPQFGTLTGTIRRSDNNAVVSGVTVAITPGSGTAPANQTTDATGVYTFSGNVPVGNGSIALSTLPAGCTFGGDTYTGVTNGGTVTKDLTLTCAAAQQTYPITGTWDTPAGGFVVLHLFINMGTAPGDPNINGTAADQFVGMQATLNYADNSKISFSAANGVNSAIGAVTGSSGTPGITSFACAVTSAITGGSNVARVTGTNVAVCDIEFQVTGTGSVTPTLTLTEAFAGVLGGATQTDIKTRVTPITIPTLTLP
jgi:hypothetical protein